MANSFVKGDFLYEGKAKRIFQVAEQPGLVWVEFKDSLTAFNGVKSGSFEEKGIINHHIASMIFRYLKDQGISSHWMEDPDDRSMVCHKVDIVPLEVVVRNRLAGSTAKRLGFEEGTEIKTTLVEFYYKKDELNDPFISDDQALLLGAVDQQKDLDLLKEKALEVNACLKNFFDEVGIELIDFKLEFGRDATGQLMLADEISPDSCRLWDKATGERLDKDRFRRELGKVEESYRLILSRLQETWESRI